MRKKLSYSQQIIKDLGLNSENTPQLDRKSETLDHEYWLDIPVSDQYGDLSRYEVSTLGRIRFKDSHKLISQSINMVGYWQCMIYDDEGKLHGPSTHNLEMLAWTGYSCRDVKPAMVVDHVDCNKLNNRIENLRYVHYKFNSQMAVKNGMWRNKTQIKCTSDNKIFDSIKQATEYYGFYQSVLSSSLRYQNECTYRGKHFVVLNQDN